MPSAISLRPILDAIGMGCHRSSEIAGRLQQPATTLTRPLAQLQQLGYIRREVPFGDDEKRSKRSLYRLADPFLRLWFRTVASRSRGQAAATHEKAATRNAALALRPHVPQPPAAATRSHPAHRRPRRARGVLLNSSTNVSGHLAASW
jgi:hypothetical protein